MGTIILVAFSVVGSIASVIALLNYEKTWQRVTIHVAYGVFIIIIAALWLSYQTKFEELTRIENQAKSIIETSGTLSSSGSQRGFILGGLAFLEKYKERFPETYKRGLIFCDNIGVSVSRPATFSDRADQDRRLEDGSVATKHLLLGIAAGK
jgi:hypothetical protein